MKNQRILIADDEADIALILKLQLEDAGFKTVRARDGAEALEILEAQAGERFSLILLDIKMPRLDGLQVLERVQQQYPEVAVVMMTAHGSEDVAVDAMKKGALDYIAKPFSTEDVQKKVEQAIRYNTARLENRRLQIQVEEERRKLDAVLQGMADILLAVDRDGRVMMVNRKGEELLRSGNKRLVNLPVEQVIRSDLPAENLPCRTVIRTGVPCLDVAYNLQLKRGAIPVLSSATPLFDGAGSLVGSVEIIRDISTLRALEQEKEDYVSMLSHDLKSPITAIVGSIDLVREGRLGPVNADQEEYLGAAIESCSEMVEMIDTLLDVHRFEAGKMAMSVRKEDPAELIRKTLERFRPVAERSGTSLDADIAGELPSVSVDRKKFFRLLNNLLSNSFKFTPEGGEITVEATVVPDIKVLRHRIPEETYPAEEVAEHGRYLQIAVIDNGSGIPADALGTIFDRFVQARNRRQGKTKGTGLGLAFCKKVMDAHHGYIWVESIEDEGSTFTLLFPLGQLK